MDKRKKLTDRQKKKIIADYIETQNYSEVARMHKTSVNTVKRVVLADKNTVNKVKEKKEENIKEVLNFLDSRKDTVIIFIDKVLKEMNDDEKIKRTPLQQLATSMGIVIDKFIPKEIEQEKEKVIIVNDLRDIDE